MCCKKVRCNSSILLLIRRRLRSAARPRGRGPGTRADGRPAPGSAEHPVGQGRARGSGRSGGPNPAHDRC